MEPDFFTSLLAENSVLSNPTDVDAAEKTDILHQSRAITADISDKVEGIFYRSYHEVHIARYFIDFVAEENQHSLKDYFLCHLAKMHKKGMTFQPSLHHIL